MRFLGAVLFASLVIVLGVAPLFASASTRVAVLPWHINGPADQTYLKDAITDMLQSRLGVSGAVEIVRADEVRESLKSTGNRPTADASAREVASALKADYVLYGSLTVLGESLSLDAKLYKASGAEITPIFASGTGLGSIIEMADAVSNRALTKIYEGDGPLAAGEKTYIGRFTEDKKGVTAESGDYVVVSRKSAHTTKILWRSTNIKGFFRSMTTADTNGDGRDEVFIMSRRRIVAGLFGPAGLSVLQEMDATGAIEFISLSSADLDGDGKDEVYVAALANGVPESHLLTQADGAYRLTSPSGFARVFVRAIQTEGEGPALIAQGFTLKSGYKSKIYRLKKDGDRFKTDGKMDLPKPVIKAGLFGFQIFDIDRDSKNDVMDLSPGNNLRVFSRSGKRDWEKHWESPDFYGGSLNIIDLPEASQDTTAMPMVYVNGEFFWADLNRDGAGEIVITRNDPGGVFDKFSEKILYYKSGAVADVSWDVALLDENWRTPDVSGYLADFRIADLDGDGSDEITMLVVDGLGGLLKQTNAHSYLLSHGIVLPDADVKK
jgi:TolB-like protein